MLFWNDDDEKDLNNNDKYDVSDEELEVVFNNDNQEEVESKKDVSKQNKKDLEDDFQVLPQLIEEQTDFLAPIPISKEMRTSFLEYAMSVIISRALPDARDGLKPVHRRILYGMHELGLTSSVAHKKSARIVGDVLGKYHPHGDSSVYEAMVRMSQDFSMRYPMVDGHGNFGSIDGDGAAAMRYTEARMSPIANLMVNTLKKNTVDFIPNYDESETEPMILPARIPNLLVNGAIGIAVGMATSIPPHNLNEIIDAAIALAQNPDLSIDDICQYVKAPDFPTGAFILETSGIRKAYETGRGSLIIRSKTRIETLKNGKSRIIVTEIPYMVNKARLIEKIASLVKNKEIVGIVDLRDESSRRGLRIVVDLKKEVVPEVVQNQLFKLTSLQTNFSFNLLALVNNKPKILNLKDALKVYIEYQYELLTKRTQFDLEKASNRAHILEGLKIATSNIDQVVKIIRSSKTEQDAQNTLISQFDLSKIQAKSITDMRLGRLTGLAIEKLNNELQELKSLISKLKDLLENKEKMTNLLIEELLEIKNKFGDQRRSEILKGVAGDIDDESLIPKKNIVILMSTNGYVKSIELINYSSQNRGGIGSKSMSTYSDDDVEKILTTKTHVDLLIFTTFGKVYRIRAYQIPQMSKQAKGTPFVNLIDISKNEKVVSLLTVNEYLEGKYLLTITKNGIAKKTPLLEYKRINRNGKKALNLKENDMLLKALIVDDNDEVIIGSALGKVVRFKSSDVRSMGRTAAGVKAINLNLVDTKTIVVGASKTSRGQFILSIGANGFGKKTHIDEYRQTKRGAKGVKSINVTKAGKLKYVGIVEGEEDILLTTKKGITIRTTLAKIATSGRGAKGVRIIRLDEDNIIKSVAIINVNKIQNEVENEIQKTQEINIDKIDENDTLQKDEI